MSYAPHAFKVGDRVRNGSAGALVVVQYDETTDLSDRVIECSCYFRAEEAEA